MRTLAFLLAFFSLTAKAVEQLPANDSRLATHPNQPALFSSVSVEDYLVMSGLGKIEKDLDSDPRGIARVVDKAVDNLVQTGLRAMSEKGYGHEAARFDGEWQHTYKNYFSKMGAMDIGDHKPWSEWLVLFYDALEVMIGHEACVRMHLDDIWVFNYAIPVVFHPTNHEWDMLEYQKHFVPFAGSCAYWLSYTACAIITWGSGAIMMVCTPIGEAIEWTMVTFVAPGLSDRVYKRANGLL